MSHNSRQTSGGDDESGERGEERVYPNKFRSLRYSGEYSESTNDSYGQVTRAQRNREGSDVRDVLTPVDAIIPEPSNTGE